MKWSWVGGLVSVLALTGCPPPCGGVDQPCCDDEEADDPCQAGLACTAGATSTCQEASPLFPENYADEYTMVRDCRLSIEHDLVSVQVWANDVAADTYLTREGELPDGTILVKEEFRDRDCTELVGWTVMQREANYFPAAGDWHWQSLAFDRTVVQDGPIAECFICHEECVEPEGFDWTCAIP